MQRFEIIKIIGEKFLTENIENGEYSYIQEAGSREKLENLVGHKINHYKLDIRFESEDVVVLIETKQSFTQKDENQLAEYLEEEKALHPNKKIICILANTNNDKIKVWKSEINDENFLKR